VQVDSDFKDDLVLIQFKLINKESQKRVNSLTFLNVPLSKYTDQNITVLQEVLIKLKNPMVLQPMQVPPHMAKVNQQSHKKKEQ
jgi:hypothetical protein